MSALTIVVRSVYNGDSPLAIQLASYGQPVVAPLLERVRARKRPSSRFDSYVVLGYVLQQHRLGRSQHVLSDNGGA